MALLVPGSLVIGIVLSDFAMNYAYIVPWIFALITFAGSLNLNLKDFWKAMARPIPVLVCIVFLHLLMPTIAYGLGSWIFQGDSYTITGYILAFLIPTGIASFIWVSMYQGNIGLTLSIILIDTLLAPILIPMMLKLMVGAEVEMNVWDIMRGLFWMIVVPSIVGMILKEWRGNEIKERFGTRLSILSKVGLAVVVFINGSVVGPYLKNMNLKVIMIIGLCFLTACLGFALAWLIARFLNWDKETTIAVTYNCGMRNNSAGAVLAIAYFPPAVSLPVVTVILFQQILAALFGKWLELYYKKNEVPIRTVDRQVSGG